MKFSMNDFIELDLNALLEVNGGSGYCSRPEHSAGSNYNYVRSNGRSGSCNIAAGFCGKVTNTANSNSVAAVSENSSAPATEKYLKFPLWKNPGYIVPPKEMQISKHLEEQSEISVQTAPPSSYFTSL